MTFEVYVAEYPGDEWWMSFAGAIGAPDDKLESVAAALMGAGSAGWFSTRIPALQGKTPQEVLSTEPKGLFIVRTVLGRMP